MYINQQGLIETMIYNCFWCKKGLEMPKWVIRSGKSKDRQYNDLNRKYTGTNNDLQNTTQKTKD